MLRARARACVCGCVCVDVCGAQYVAEREAFIATTIHQLRGTNPFDWRHLTLQIKFSKEGVWQQGQDWGGLTKAFVKFMSECLFDVRFIACLRSLTLMLMLVLTCSYPKAYARACADTIYPYTELIW